MAGVIHAIVRSELALGDNPVDALVKGVVAAESWLTVMGQPGLLRIGPGPQPSRVGCA